MGLRQGTRPSVFTRRETLADTLQASLNRNQGLVSLQPQPQSFPEHDEVSQINRYAGVLQKLH